MKADGQKRWISIGALSLIIGLLDYFTGYEFSFFIFYFLPVSLAAWFIGKLAAVVSAIICSILWAAVYILTGHFIITDFLTIWNASIRLVTFLVIGLSVATIKNTLRIEKETARKLSASITEREKTEAALRARNEHFRLAAKAAHIGTYSRNLQSGEDYWSPEFLAIHGVALHDALPLSDGIPSVVHPEDRQKVLGELSACLDRTGPPEFSTRHRIVLPSGEIRWVMLRGVVEFDLQGRPIHKHGIVMDITDREREQQALQESEERFRIMADGLPLIVWVHDAFGRQQFVNRTFLDFFGVTAEEMKGDRWQQLLHPDDREAHAAEFLACVRGRRPFHAEARVRRRDGGWAWIESWGRPRASASGEYLGYVGTSADITERKRIEAAIRKTEASYRMLFETMDEAFAIKEMIEEPDGRVDFLFVEANPAFERQTGLRDVAGRTMRQLMPGIEPRWMERYAKVVRTGERIRFEDYAAGLERWFRVLCWRIEGSEKPWAAILATDITERKKSEDALRIAYSRLQTLFDHRIEGVGIAISNAAGNVIQANDHLLKIFGCTREELISGKVDWRALTPPEWQEVDEYALRQLKNGGLYCAVEKEYVRGDGSRVPVLVTGVTMPGDNGEILSFILDITERKRFEQSLKQLNMTLEHQVAERTKLAERRSKQLQMLAMELIESEEQERRRISELLHDDLQQLLAATLMQLDSCSEKFSAVAELDFVRRLLKESMLKARSLSHELSPTMLYHSGLVAGLQWLANQMNEKFGLDVQIDVLTDEGVDFSLAPMFIYRAVQELLFNVVKHSTAKSARVALTNTEQNIQISVSDEGKGFNTDLLESDSARTGLGLVGVRERAIYFGGSLEIKSSPGQGSRFTLILPITPQPGDQSAK